MKNKDGSERIEFGEVRKLLAGHVKRAKVLGRQQVSRQLEKRQRSPGRQQRHLPRGKTQQQALLDRPDDSRQGINIAHVDRDWRQPLQIKFACVEGDLSTVLSLARP
jgi:hypothetical protein